MRNLRHGTRVVGGHERARLPRSPQKSHAQAIKTRWPKWHHRRRDQGRRGAGHAPHAGDLRGRAPSGRGRDGAPPHFALVVGGGGRAFNQFLAAVAGDPDGAPAGGTWQPLVVSFGYCIGFIMAVLSRQQLFTEITITAVLPVAAEVTWGNVVRMARLWAIVLAANLAGTLFAALFCTFTPGALGRHLQRNAGDQPRSVGLRLVGDGVPRDCRGLSDGRHGLADAGRGRMRNSTSSR